MKLDEDQAFVIRAAATDCSRAADDYRQEGLEAVADLFAGHAAALWELTQERSPPQRAPRQLPGYKRAARGR